ncbi:serine/threonine protein phosphatase [Pelomyxa schiedti]|nr:serine/threonine protein phosphatase [Pelomyxa schiedti]
MARGKDMSKFGTEWVNHFTTIQQNWCQLVNPEDIVLVSGDISWALRLSDAMVDLQWLHALPGQKVLVEGNHDMWWPSAGKLKNLQIPSSIHLLVGNNVVTFGNVAITGTRLWDFPDTVNWPAESALADPPEPQATNPSTEQPQAQQPKPNSMYLQAPNDAKIATRELNRLKSCLENLDRVCSATPNSTISHPTSQTPATPAETSTTETSTTTSSSSPESTTPPSSATAVTSNTAATAPILKIVMVHYPPVSSTGQPTTVTNLMSQHRVNICTYGHLHNLRRLSPSTQASLRGTDCTIPGDSSGDTTANTQLRCILTAADWLHFTPTLIANTTP